MFPDCRAKRSRNCSLSKSNKTCTQHHCQSCQPSCSNQRECEKPFLCQELNSSYWCKCRPPIHRDYCEYCKKDAPTEDLMKDINEGDLKK